MPKLIEDPQITSRQGERGRPRAREDRHESWSLEPDVAVLVCPPSLTSPVFLEGCVKRDPGAQFL
jgi:hypothetical protein